MNNPVPDRANDPARVMGDATTPFSEYYSSNDFNEKALRLNDLIDQRRAEAKATPPTDLQEASEKQADPLEGYASPGTMPFPGGAETMRSSGSASSPSNLKDVDGVFSRPATTY